MIAFVYQISDIMKLRSTSKTIYCRREKSLQRLKASIPFLWRSMGFPFPPHPLSTRFEQKSLNLIFNVKWTRQNQWMTRPTIIHTYNTIMNKMIVSKVAWMGNLLSAFTSGPSYCSCRSQGDPPGGAAASRTDEGTPSLAASSSGP